MKLLLSLLLSISFITANEKQKTEEELVAEFMQLEKEIQDEKAKTKEYEKLEKTVNELAETLGVDEK